MSLFIRLMGKNFPLQYSVSIYFVSRDLKACHSSEINFNQICQVVVRVRFVKAFSLSAAAAF